MGINERCVAVASIAKLIPSNPKALANPLRREGDGLRPSILKIHPNPSFVKEGLTFPAVNILGLLVKISR